MTLSEFVVNRILEEEVNSSEKMIRRRSSALQDLVRTFEKFERHVAANPGDELNEARYYEWSHVMRTLAWIWKDHPDYDFTWM